MYLYWITKKKHSTDLSGEGSRITGGRWNSKGRRVLYASENISLSVCENLVHFKTKTSPANMVCIKLEIPDSSISQEFVSYDYTLQPLSFIEGDKWIDSMGSLALRVPSIVVPGEYNILVNPLHTEFNNVKSISIKEFSFDFRLF